MPKINIVCPNLSKIANKIQILKFNLCIYNKIYPIYPNSLKNE